MKCKCPAFKFPHRPGSCKTGDLSAVLDTVFATEETFAEWCDGCTYLKLLPGYPEPGCSLASDAAKDCPAVASLVSSPFGGLDVYHRWKVSR
jgi:hypothetical protein